ncbi:MAG: hypothetical protein KAI96_04910 [Thermodesulfovibrionia bacterium]|nr:hypothetical protein [Thermodesulfovibrionia bacterium]
MSKKERPLPKPLNTPFGRKRQFEGDENRGPLMADEIAGAMSEGKLDEYLHREMPNSEYARKLAEMMMGMTGMMPSEKKSPQRGRGKKISTARKAQSPGNKTSVPLMPSDDVLSAAQKGDVKGLIELLAREHKKRRGEGGESPVKRKKGSQEIPVIDKEIIDKFIEIASDNNLSVDWLLFRAVKKYVKEYQKTEKL